MKPESTDQDELQQMLARKREQPAPQFFKGLSSEVLDRIQHPKPPPPPTFRQKFGLDFDSKPVLVCVSGVVVCGLLAYALVSSRNVQEPPPAPATDSTVPNLSVQSTPGQMDSMPPVKPPGAKPIETPRPGDPAGINPARPDSLELRSWPVQKPAPTGGK